MNTRSVSLTAVPVGATAQLDETHLDGDTRELLRSLGLTDASPLRVCTHGDPCIIQVRTTRIGLCAAVAGAVYVTVEQGGFGRRRVHRRQGVQGCDALSSREVGMRIVSIRSGAEGKFSLGGPAFLDQSAITTEKVGAKLTYAAPASRLGGVNALFGLDLTRDDSAQVLARTNRVWVPYTVLNEIAPVVQMQRPVTNRVLLSGGLRAEVATLSVDDFVTIPSARSTPVASGSPSFTELLPNAGIIVYPWRPLSFYASYSEGFTMPDAGRVLRAVNTPGQGVDTLLDIDPVVTGNIEVGGTWTSSRSRMHVAYYRSNAERGSLLELLPSGVFSVQRQRTEIQGVDLRVDVPLSVDWLAGLTYSWIDGRLDSDADGRVDTDLDGLDIGPNRVNLFVEGTRRWLNGRVQVSRFFDRSFGGTAARPGRDFSGYTLADLSLAATTGAGVIRLGLDNLFNHQYTTYFSQVEPNQGANTFFAGVGRSLLLSFERRF